MPAYLEVWRASGPEALPLGQEAITIGKSRSNDVVITTDETVSRAHAVLQRLRPGWVLHDLGSRNGTFVNGERVTGEKLLHHGDEIRIGATRVVFRSDAPAGLTAATAAAEPAPELTRRERDVLRELCRPFLSGDLFTEPASIREIAKELFLTEATVKQYLIRLYSKFNIQEGDGRRRVRLANDAIHRGAISMADLRDR